MCHKKIKMPERVKGVFPKPKALIPANKLADLEIIFFHGAHRSNECSVNFRE